MEKVSAATGGMFGSTKRVTDKTVRHPKNLIEEMQALREKGFNVARK
jgi:hypothetical protein